MPVEAVEVVLPRPEEQAEPEAAEQAALLQVQVLLVEQILEAEAEVAGRMVRLFLAQAAQV